MRHIIRSIILILFLTGGSYTCLFGQKSSPPPISTGSTKTTIISRPSSSTKTPLTKEQIKLNQELLKLQTEYQIRLYKIKKEYSNSYIEKEKISIEIELLVKKHALELYSLKSEIEKLSLENNMQGEKQKKAIQQIKNEKEKLKLEMELLNEKQKKELALLKVEKEKLVLTIGIETEKQKSAVLKLKAENEVLNLKNARIISELKAEELKYKEATTKLQTDINMRDLKKKWDSEVNRDIEKIKNPYKDKILTISDRRIQLNGPIITGTADYITERIHYYNNKSSEYPIFIVIDDSPGGSVMEGYRIMKAMDASKAPIHVVVKSFAASMAACILTRAKQSYAYPNAIILHHQPTSGAYGNLTEQKEQLDIFKKWAVRLHKPIAKKMNITLEKFYEEMYKHSSMGDWEEFADDAQKLKWVDSIVDEIREESFHSKPTNSAPKPRFFFFFLKKDGATDDKGDGAYKLPKLQPFDFYFIYNAGKRYYWD